MLHLTQCQQQQQQLKYCACAVCCIADDTIAGLLSAVQAQDWSWPPYASNMLWELWEDTQSTSAEHSLNLHSAAAKEAPPVAATAPAGKSNLFVRILYNGLTLKLPWCTLSNCPLEEFVEWMQNSAVPEDLLAECLATP